MAYLTVTEYVARFGEQETTLLTNEQAAQPGVPKTFDSGKVEAALSDATEVVEGYLGTRYALPVADPPRLVKGWTAHIAREALYLATPRANVPDAVERAADLSRAALKDVQAGKMTLPIEPGQTPPATTNLLGDPASSMDREAPIFAGTGALDAFIAPFTGNPLPNWRR